MPMQDDLDGFAAHSEVKLEIDEAEALQRELETADAAYIVRIHVKLTLQRA